MIRIEKPKRPSARASDSVWKNYFEKLDKIKRAEAAAKKILGHQTKKRKAAKKSRGRRR